MKKALPSERGEYRVDRVGARVLAEYAVQLCRDIVAVESFEIDPLGPPAALELGEPRPERMAPAELVGAECGDDRDAGHTQLVDEIREQVARRSIGPVQILDEEEQWFVERESLEQAEHDLEEAARAAGCVTLGVDTRSLELGHQPRELGRRGTGVRANSTGAVLAHESPQHLHHRPEGRAGIAEIDARSGEHPPPGHAGCELPQEPGLADSGLAADDDRRHFARRGAGGRGFEALQWPGPSDERRTRDPRCHRVHCRRPVRRHATLLMRPVSGAASGRVASTVVGGISVASAFSKAVRSSVTA